MLWRSRHHHSTLAEQMRHSDGACIAYAAAVPSQASFWKLRQGELEGTDSMCCRLPSQAMQVLLTTHVVRLWLYDKLGICWSTLYYPILLLHACCMAIMITLSL